MEVGSAGETECEKRGVVVVVLRCLQGDDCHIILKASKGGIKDWEN